MKHDPLLGISKKVAGAKNKELLKALLEENAEKMCCDRILVAEIVLTNGRGLGSVEPSLSVIFSSLNDLELQTLVLSQVDGLLESSQDSSAISLPKIWSETKREWLDLIPASFEYSTSSTSGSQIQNVCVFSKTGPGRYAIVVGACRDLTEKLKIWAFHSTSLFYIEQVRRLSEKDTGAVLSRNERYCLVWGACGKTSSEIATILSLSEHTVNHYFTIAANKLGATNRMHAMAKAIRMGLISFDEIN